MFLNAGGEEAGEIWIMFKDPVQYAIGWCSPDTNIATTLPAADAKTWKITLVRTSSEPRVLIHCDDVEVFDLQLSDSVCTNPKWKDTWKTYWSRKVEKIEFTSSDSASDQYRSTGEYYH